MFNIKISGFKTKAQAEEFVKWYEGQGEQYAAIWFEARKEDGDFDIRWMPTDCKETYPLSWDGDTLAMKVDPR